MGNVGSRPIAIKAERALCCSGRPPDGSRNAEPAEPGLRSDIAVLSEVGLDEGWRDDGWMILKRGGLTLEFFPHPDLNPSTGNFSCCLRLDDMQALYEICKDAGLPEQCFGWPRLHPPSEEDSGKTIAYMVDLDGTLVRLIQN